MLLAMPLPSRLAAQVGAHRAAGAFRPTIPHEPMRSDGAHAGPLSEPGRPPSSVPYVRDNHWYGHAAPNDARFHLARPFPFGRFALAGPSHTYRITRVDLGARRFWLPGGYFEIADWEWGVTAPWCWTCDDFTVYLDPDHDGWYLVYDVRMGEYAHAQVLGA
jgi:hypothetical protein